MYLEHFGIRDYPFGLTPNTQYYCDLPGHQEALNVILYSLHSGEGFIQITGEVGLGKTSLCRKLLDALGDPFITAYIPNPRFGALELCKAIATELGVEFPKDAKPMELFQLISNRLLELRLQGKKAVLIIDEAQTLTDNSLEMLRLFTNFETESEKLLQIVLFGQPELQDRLSQHRMRPLRQRIAFSYNLEPLEEEQMIDYLAFRLAKAGYTKAFCFDPNACELLFLASGGIPRLINILSHKAMLRAYGNGEKAITKHSMKAAIMDSLNIIHENYWNHKKWKIVMSTAGIIFGILAFGLLYVGLTRGFTAFL